MASEKYSVTASVLNVRSGPSTSYPKVSSVSNGDIVTVSKVSNNWGMIGTNKWVSMAYLKSLSSNGRITPSYVPTKDLDNRPIYLMQTDSRWKNKMYSAVNDPSQTIGSGGCGPSAASMIVNEWVDNMYSPVEACSWAASAGYRTANNGTYWSMMKAIAVKYGFKFTQTGDANAAKNFLNTNKGSLVICIMGKGNWTSSGHFILMYKCDGTYVYINDPASTSTSRQKNTFALLKSQCRQYFCFAKPENKNDATSWADKSTITTVQEAFVVAATKLNVRKEPTTSNGDNIIDTFNEGSLVIATKKCGDWYYVTGITNSGKKISGWSAASYLNDANIDNVDSDIASLCKEALKYLTNIGFITSPDYWKSHIFDINYLTNLVIAITNAIDSRGAKKPATLKEYTVENAIQYLNAIEVINSPDYWKNNYKSIKYLDDLIVKAAQWLS